MWFQSPDYGGFYWLTDDAARDGEQAPTRIPIDAPLRAITEGDWTWDYFLGRLDEGRGQNASYRWVVNDNFFENGIAAKAEFPRLVTTKTLAEFFAKCSQKSGAIRLDNNTTITLSKDFSRYTLSVKGIHVLVWLGDRVSWVFQGPLAQVQTDSIKKYLGKSWKFIFKDGIACLENEAGDWVAVSPWAILTVDGKILEKEDYEKSYSNEWFKRYAKLKKSIYQYVDSITPETVELATKSMTSKTHSIFTRCIGCQNTNGKHLELHMARKDLDAYLIYSAYDGFGQGDPLAGTWNLIGYPTLDKVREFKVHFNNFLLDTLRTEVNGPIFLPIERRPDSNQWTLGGAPRPLRFLDNRERVIANFDANFDARQPVLRHRGEVEPAVAMPEIPFPFPLEVDNFAGEWDEE